MRTLLHARRPVEHRADRGAELERQRLLSHESLGLFGELVVDRVANDAHREEPGLLAQADLGDGQSLHVAGQRGVRAKKAAEILSKNGYKQISLCAMTQYKEKGYPLIYPKAEK